MADTNWCTFCDCAIHPNSLFKDFIYCSEECFKQDALSDQSFYINTNNKQNNSQLSLNQIHNITQSWTNAPSQFDQQTRRVSCSSVSSDDLAAMYFDMLPSTPSNEKTIDSQQSSVKPALLTPPLLPASLSPTSSNECLLGTPIDEYLFTLPLQEKQSSKSLLPNICLSHANVL